MRSYLLKYSLILSLDTLSGRFPTHRCLVSLTMLGPGPRSQPAPSGPELRSYLARWRGHGLGLTITSLITTTLGTITAGGAARRAALGTAVSLLAAAGWSLSCHGTLRLTWQSHSPGVTVCSRGRRPGRRAVLRRAAPLGPTQKKQNGRLAAAGAGGGAAR